MSFVNHVIIFTLALVRQILLQKVCNLDSSSQYHLRKYKNCYIKKEKQISAQQAQRFQVTPRCSGINGGLVRSVCNCVNLEGWSNSISMANFLFFSASVLKHSRSSSSPEQKQHDHQRRQQDETQEGAWSPNIWQGKASMTRSISE